MKLKTAKYVLFAFCALMLASLLLCSVTKEIWLGYLGLGFAFAGAAFWIIFGRCPNCEHFLGRTDGKYCPYCGANIEW